MSDTLQRALALSGALLTLPIVALVALLVRLDSDGPAIYRARRHGPTGTPFDCFKIRTMRWPPDPGSAGLTTLDDDRVTRVGRVLRRWHLDELPQLWNVVRGEMRLVGPRPEDPRFVDTADPLHRLVFGARPGITGVTQLAYVDEAELFPALDPESHYREVILPAKLNLDARYLKYRSWRLDAWILLHTALAALGRPPSAAQLERLLPAD